MIERWNTMLPLDPAFAARWRARVESSPFASFALALDYLGWEAGHGRHALAVLAEEGGRTGAVVLRNEPRGWVSGWPWRWQLLIADRPANGALGFAAADAEWLFRIALGAVADQRQVRMFAPHPPPRGVHGFAAGATIFQSIQHGDDEILKSMGSGKRRMVRRALEAGYQVAEAAGADEFRAFHEVQSAARRAVGPGPGPAAPEAPAPGEHWREWELPWMWLLLARKDGVVQSGVGDGVIPGGTVEGRTAASTLAARREGAFALLCYEEARRARDRGHRWLNHGGDTAWKREVSGRLGFRLPVWCWLGGGRWELPNAAEGAWRSLRPAAVQWYRKVRGGK